MADLNALIAQGAQFNMPDQLGQYAKMQQLQAGQQQMRTGALQEQTAGMQLQKLQEDRANMAALSQKLSVKGVTPRQYFEALQTSGDPQHQQLGIEGLMKLDESEKYDAILKSRQTIPGQPPAQLAGALGSGTAFMDNALPNVPAPVNALRPPAAPMAATNALAPQAAAPMAADPVAAIDAEIAVYENLKDSRAKDKVARLQKQRDELTKTHVVGGSLLRGTGDVVGTAPMTAYQKSQNEIAQGQLKVSQGQLGVSQGQLKVARDRLAREGASLDPAENAAISKAIIEGRLDPTKVNGRNAKIIAGTLLADPTVNIKELGIEAAGAGAGARALGTQSAKILTAANEAGQMVDVVRDYSSKIDRTQYPTINAIQNAVDKGTGGTEIVKLNTAINALVNSYARAINPTGVSTVSDKNHAREIINANYANGQINAILDVMGQEMDIAKASPAEAAKQLKAGRTGAAPASSAGEWKVVR